MQTQKEFKLYPVFRFEANLHRMLPRGVRLQDNAPALQVREVGKSVQICPNMETVNS